MIKLEDQQNCSNLHMLFTFFSSYMSVHNPLFKHLQTYLKSICHKSLRFYTKKEVFLYLQEKHSHGRI